MFIVQATGVRFQYNKTFYDNYSWCEGYNTFLLLHLQRGKNGSVPDKPFQHSLIFARLRKWSTFKALPSNAALGLTRKY